MKKLLVIAALASGIFGATSAYAQASASTSASGSVTLLRPITITKTADLEFGRVVKPSTGTGTVSMTNASDAVTAASGAVAISGITTSRAKFTIDGEGGQGVSVTVPATFNIVNGAVTITVTTTQNLGASTTLNNALGSAGSATLDVGGSFNVPSTNATGLYTGTLNVSVAYN